MSFTDPADIANASTPSGSTTPAKNIDNWFRDFKTSLTERMNQILGASQWASDPVVDGTTVKSIAAIVTELATKLTLTTGVNGRLLKATGTSAIDVSSLTEATVSAAVDAVNNSTVSDVDTSNSSGALSTNLAAGQWLVCFRGNALTTTPCTATITVDSTEHSKIESSGDYFCLTTVIVLGSTTQVDFGSTGGTGVYSFTIKKLNLV